MRRSVDSAGHRVEPVDVSSKRRWFRGFGGGRKIAPFEGGGLTPGSAILYFFTQCSRQFKSE
jgi:hypothetical protein